MGFLVHLMPTAQLHFQWRTHVSLHCLAATVGTLLVPSGATLSLCRCVCSTCSREGRDESRYTEFASAGMNDLLLPQRTEGDSKV